MTESVNFPANALTFLRISGLKQPELIIKDIYDIPSMVIAPDMEIQLINLNDIPPDPMTCLRDETKPVCMVFKSLSSLSDNFLRLSDCLKNDQTKASLRFSFVFEPNSRYFAMYQMDTNYDQTKARELAHDILGNVFTVLKDEGKLDKVPGEADGQGGNGH